MTPRQNPLSSTRLRVGAVLGVIVLVVLAGWTVSALTGASPSASSGIGQASLAPGASSSASPGDSGLGSSVNPGTSAGSSPSAGGSPAPRTTPAPTKKPGPKPTPAPTPRPVTAIKLGLAMSGFSHPIFVTGAHDGTNRLFVVQQTGQIKVVVNGKAQATSFLDISGLIKYGGEQGLLGLAFHPQFKTNGRFYVYYNQSGTGNIMVGPVHGGP